MTQAENPNLEAQYDHWRELGIPVDDVIRWKEFFSRFCDLEGIDWTESRTRKRLERIILAAPALGAECIIPALKLAVWLEDRENPTFYQDRYLRDGTLKPVEKIRSMKVGSEPDKDTSDYAASVKPSEDKRNTRVGSFLRRTDLDELPQLGQVWRDPNLSFVGIRIKAEYGVDHMMEHRSEAMDEWWESYGVAGAAVMGLNELFNPNTKDDLSRIPFDNATAHFTSPGLDAYVYAHSLEWYMRRLSGLNGFNDDNIDSGLDNEPEVTTT